MLHKLYTHMKYTLKKKENHYYLFDGHHIIADNINIVVKNFIQLRTNQIETLLGKVDTEKLVDDILSKEFPQFTPYHKHSFKLGYERALQDNAEKKFTLEDMRKAFESDRNDSKMNYRALDLLMQEQTKCCVEIEEKEYPLNNCKACNDCGVAHCAYPDECGAIKIGKKPLITNGYINIIKILN